MSAALRLPRSLLRLLATALVGGGPLMLVAASNPSTPPVYSAEAVREGLIRSPGTWVGRTVWVRAIAASRCVAWLGGPVPVCAVWQPSLIDTPNPAVSPPLLLRAAPQPALLGALRRLPLAGRLVPVPQRIRWGRLTAYRVRPGRAPAALCAGASCYEALLLDTAVVSPGMT